MPGLQSDIKDLGWTRGQQVLDRTSWGKLKLGGSRTEQELFLSREATSPKRWCCQKYSPLLTGELKFQLSDLSILGTLAMMPPKQQVAKGLEGVFRKSKPFCGNCPNPSTWKQRILKIKSLFSVNCSSCLFVQSKLNGVCLSWGGGFTTRAMWDRVLYVWKSKCCFLSAQLQSGLLSLPWGVERLCLFLSSLCSVSHTSLWNIWY